MGDNSSIFHRHRIATPAGDYDATVTAVRDLVLALEQVAGQQAASVGIGTPGSFSTLTGRMKGCNSTCLNGRPLKQDLEAALGRSIRMANDADCLALSEASDGAGRDAHSVFGVILGTGVGGGIVVHGQLLSGPNNLSGEWGHNPLPWPKAGEYPGVKCWCGRMGCIETWLSGAGLSRDYLAYTDHMCSAEEIVARLASDEPAAMAVYRRYLDRLARALASVINLIDPEVVVLGGGLSNLPGLVAGVEARWLDYVFSDEVRTRLVTAVHGDSSGVRGAAWLWPAA